MIQIPAQEIMQLTVQCDQALEVGKTHKGYLRVIPIIGGYVTGKLSGQVLKGGADWNTELTGGGNHLFAKYEIQTTDGWLISILNEGWAGPMQDGIIALTSPKFEAALDSPYAWLNFGLYMSQVTFSEKPGYVLVTIYQLQSPIQNPIQNPIQIS